jgi:acyl carrier protein
LGGDRIQRMKYLDHIIRTICETLDVHDSDFDEDTELSEIGMDSLDVSELALIIEDEYGVELTDEDVEQSKTIGNLAEIVEGKLEIESAYE